jgi:diguanylate cyclase (GGDEF)-like protein/PAS domain S-box-containing protein
MLRSPRNRFIFFVTLCYVVLALLWIFLSDHLLLLMATPEAVIQLSTAKGVFFVLATATLFFLALRAVPASSASTRSSLLDALTAGMLQGSQPAWMTYGFACLISISILVLRLTIPVEISQQPLMILFIPPIILSALIGGLGPGLLATAITGLGLDLLAHPPLHQQSTATYIQVQWVFLMFNGILVSLLSVLLRRSINSLAANKHLLEAVVSGTSDAVFIKDRQGRYLLANAATAAFVNRTQEQLIGLDDRDLFDEASAHELQSKDAAIMADGRVQTQIEHLSTKDGETMVFMVTKGPVFDTAGQVIGLFGISRDITLQQQDQEALRTSEAALKQAQRLASIGNWEWNQTSDTPIWSEEICRILGRDPELPPADYAEIQNFFTAEGWAQLTALVEECRRTGQTYECDIEVVTADGVHRWVKARGDAVQDANGLVTHLRGTMQDITEAKLLALQLQASEERLQLVVEATSDGFWDWDIPHQTIYRSPRYYEVSGYSPQEDGHHAAFFFQTVHPDDRQEVQQCIEAHRRGESSHLDFTFRLNTRQGDTRWMRILGRTVAKDRHGNPTRLVGSISDITEQKQLNEDLRFVLTEAADAIWITDRDGHIMFSNPSANRLTGLDSDHSQQLIFAELLPLAHRAAWLQHIAALGQEKYQCQEWDIQKADGEIATVEITTVHLLDGRYMAFGRDRTSQKQAEIALKEREQQLARVIEGTDQGYWDWNLQTNVFVVSPRWETMLGYQPGEMDVSPDNWPALVFADDLAAAKASIERHLRGDAPSHEVEIRCRTKAGGWRWILSRGRVVTWDEQGKPLMMSGTHTDITERKLLEQAQQEAAVVFDSSYEGIMVVNAKNVITKVNAAFTRITGYSADEAIGRTTSLLSSALHNDEFYQAIWHSLHEHDFWRGEIWNKRKNGEIYAELLSISAVRDAEGKIQHYVGLFSDITQLKAHERELDRVAHYDPLTGAPNRRLLSDRLDQAIAHSIRNHKSCAVCFLDLDNFKAINDRYGHDVGDQLLIGVTHNLKSILRADDTLSRLGGDEFVLLLTDITSPENCTLILDRILEAIGQVIVNEQIQISISASIGVTLYPEDNVDPDTLLRHADQAMYLAKEAGKNRYQLFDPESERKAQHQRKYLATIQQALGNEEFQLYYQPKVNLMTGQIIGAEALIRWQHPERGLLSPIEFLPHLHGSHLETNVGEWVIHHAIQQAECWHRSGLLMTVSANVSAHHLLQPGFYTHLQAELAQHPEIRPELFELEVLESAAIADMEQAIAILHKCRQLGIHFALDDFGTGYSSLTYLRKLPIDTLKIDQSFVRDMLTDSDDLGIVKGVIQLATVFNRQVIAEGVETLAHGKMLRELGCHLAQGYGIARPMPAAAIEPWCQQWKAQKPWLSMQ